MPSLCSRFPALATLAVLGWCNFLPALAAANWYVDAAAGAGRHDGTSWSNAWTTLATISWPALSGGDVVWVRGGPYNERLLVAKSGAAPKARIIFKGIGAPTIRGVDGGAFNHIAVIGFEITHASPANKYDAIRLTGASGWLIQDNHIHHTYGGGVDGHYNTANNNIIIRGNLFEAICAVGGGAASAPVIEMYGDSNLIEYNTILQSLDRVRAFGTGNVIRNNYFGATDTALYPNSTPYPFHTDGFQSYVSTRPLTQLLYERNWDEDNTDTVGGTNAHGIIIQRDSAAALLSWMIFRFNVLVRPGGPAFIFKDVVRVYGYNLTSIGVGNGSPNLFRSAVSYDRGPPCDLQDWRNNTWSFSPRTVDRSGIFSDNRPTHFTSDYQHRFNAGVLPAAPHNLPDANPLFTNPATDDYTLQPNSPLRNAGGPITTAASGGSNATTLRVLDSRRLFDGWGIAEPDWIKIGSDGDVQISAIDYAAEIVTLASPRSWNAGDPVRVLGSEDVGALPSAHAKPFVIVNTTSRRIPAGAATLSATCTPVDAVRKIEFLVDGIPVGESFTSPYSVPWISDGTSHDIEARAYGAWASRTLWKSQTVSANQ